jgi:hypothetical protein
MKMNRITELVRCPGVALAVAIAAFSLIGNASAQSQLVGDDGIAVSPKVRAQLNERKAQTTPATAAVAAMACPECKDAWVARADPNPKGLGARSLLGQTTKLVAQHLCPACETAITVGGEGKAKYDIATHQCGSWGATSFACCSKVKGSPIPAKGMEKNVEMATLK